MIRLVGRRLIIPCGDTGSFSIPSMMIENGCVAVFTIFDRLTHTKVFSKIVNPDAESETLTISFDHNDTIDLPAGKYQWDIQIYKNPEYDDEGRVINGDEINSYYAAFTLPICEIRTSGSSMNDSIEKSYGTNDALNEILIMKKQIEALEKAVQDLSNKE